MKNRYLSVVSFVFIDVALACVSIIFSFLLTGEKIDFSSTVFLFTFVFWPAINVVCFYIFKIYNILWRYFGLNEIVRIFAAVMCAFAACFVSQRAVFSKGFDINILLTMLFLLLLFVVIQRWFFKKLYKRFYPTSDSAALQTNLKGNIMLIGAGSASQTIIKEFAENNKYANCKIKCAIDDDEYKIGQYISGVKIVGGREYIIEAVEKYDISTIIFAIPSCSNAQKTEILNICQHTDCDLKIVPAICSLYDFDEVSTYIRKVEIEDLLGRDPIDINKNYNLDYVKDKVVLVTGGGGTIGSELCRQIAMHSPKQIIVFDVYENNAYEIQNELLATYPNLNLATLIGSVRDSKRLDYIFRTYKPDIVYHAAAHKHVPLMEESPNETVKNNIFGTYKTAACANKYGTQKFVLISTDKAVNPTNIMGASKRICEMIIQHFNSRSDTEFVAVRFGNVLGSNGSVIPLFKKQIEAGGPVTVTSPNIIRYFMTIPEAVSLVLQAGANANGGEIFVLDMGEPVKILTLAENLIKLSGFTPYKDIQIKFTGLRPGEKLYEELLMSEEGLKSTDNKLIFIGKPIEFDESEFLEVLAQMKEVMYNENADVRHLVKKIVPTYQYSEKNNLINN